MDAKQFYFDMLKAFIDTMQATLDAARCAMSPLKEFVDKQELMDKPVPNSENMIVKTEEPIEAPNPSMEAPVVILEPSNPPKEAPWELPEAPKEATTELPEAPKEQHPFYKAAPPAIKCKEYAEDSRRVRRELLTPSFLERLPTFAGVDLATLEERREWQHSCEAFR